MRTTSICIRWISESLGSDFGLIEGRRRRYIRRWLESKVAARIRALPRRFPSYRTSTAQQSATLLAHFRTLQTLPPFWQRQYSIVGMPWTQSPHRRRNLRRRLCRSRGHGPNYHVYQPLLNTITIGWLGLCIGSRFICLQLVLLLFWGKISRPSSVVCFATTRALLAYNVEEKESSSWRVWREVPEWLYRSKLVPASSGGTKLWDPPTSMLVWSEIKLWEGTIQKTQSYQTWTFSKKLVQYLKKKKKNLDPWPKKRFAKEMRDAVQGPIGPEIEP